MYNLAQGWGPRGLSSTSRTARGQKVVALALVLNILDSNTSLNLVWTTRAIKLFPDHKRQLFFIPIYSICKLTILKLFTEWRVRTKNLTHSLAALAIYFHTHCRSHLHVCVCVYSCMQSSVCMFLRVRWPLLYRLRANLC